MSEDIRIDSHKLIYHPERVSKWLSGENIYPIGVEIAPSGTCNHRCIFCALDYMEYKPVLLDKDLILKNIKKMSEKGLKSAVFAGEGEPLINKNTPDIIKAAKGYGVDTSMSTNGVLFTPDVAKDILNSLTWIRFSISAGTPETYKTIHRTKPEDLEKVMDNLSRAVELKRKNGYKTTLGVQLLLIPENYNEVIMLGRKLREIGVDYYTVKPFSKHPKSICSMNSSFDYENYLEFEKELKELETESFKVYFRSSAMKKLKCDRGYDRCRGLPFFTYIDANANVWPCIVFLGDMKLCYGSLKEESFVELWEGKRRSQIMEDFWNKDISECRELCRLDEINKYLHQLKNPGLHVNFI